MRADWIERTRARILRDVDPAIVEAGRLSRLAFAELIGNPRRCDTNELHPDGSCLYCGAWNGEQCRARTQNTPDSQRGGA